MARVGGITPWLKVAHAAEAFNVAVSPHFLMELHVSLAAAVPNGIYVEHIPQLQAVTHSTLAIEDGCVTPPTYPASGSTGTLTPWTTTGSPERLEEPR